MTMNLTNLKHKQTMLKFGDEELTFTELTLADLADFRNEMRREKERLNTERRERLLQDAKKIGGVDQMALLKLTDTSISEDELDAEMASVDGLGHLVYLSLKHVQKEITKDEAMRIVTIARMAEIQKAMGLTATDGEQTEGGSSDFRSARP